MENCLMPGLPDDVAQECLIRVPLQKLSLLHSVCRQWRQEILSFNFHRRRRLAGISQPVFLFYHDPRFVTHKETMFEENFSFFDPKSGKCFTLHKSSIPTTPPRIIINYDMAVGVGHSMVVFNWLDDGTGHIRIYDFLTNSWRNGASIPGPPLHRFAYESDNVKRVFICGGYDHGRNMSRSITSYDLDEDRWEALPDMPEGCKPFKVIFNDGILYAFSTQRFARDFCRIDKFNVKAREWSGETFKWLCKFRRFPNRFTIGGDGRIYYSHGVKLWVKENNIWLSLLDLPASYAKKGVFLRSWRGGLLITPCLSITSSDTLDHMHTLELNGHNQNLFWILHKTADNIKHEKFVGITLLEI